MNQIEFDKLDSKLIVLTEHIRETINEVFFSGLKQKEIDPSKDLNEYQKQLLLERIHQMQDDLSWTKYSIIPEKVDYIMDSLSRLKRENCLPLEELKKFNA